MRRRRRGGQACQVAGRRLQRKQRSTLNVQLSTLKYLITDKAARSLKLGGKQRHSNRHKSSVRAKVEFPFRLVKHLWGHAKVRYRGLAKNTAQLHFLFALSNLFQARRALLAA